MRHGDRACRATSAPRQPQPPAPFARARSYRRLRHGNEGETAEIRGVVEFGTAVGTETLVATGKDVEYVARLRRRWEGRDDGNLAPARELDAAREARVAATRPDKLTQPPIAGDAGQ